VIPEGGKHPKDCLGRSPTPPGDSSPGQLPAEVRSETTRSVMVWPPAAGYVAAKILHNKMLHSATRRTKNPNQPHAHEPPPHIREREKREKETERKRDREKEREREREREHGDVVKTIGFTNISKQTQPMCQFALSSLRMKM
jgi:hypothetical protein